MSCTCIQMPPVCALFAYMCEVVQYLIFPDLSRCLTVLCSSHRVYKDNPVCLCRWFSPCKCSWDPLFFSCLPQATYTGDLEALEMKFMSSSCLSGSLRHDVQSGSHVSAKQAAYFFTAQHMGIMNVRQGACSWQCWFLLLKSLLFHCRISTFSARRLVLKIGVSHGHVRDAHLRFVRNHEKHQFVDIIHWIYLSNDCRFVRGEVQSLGSVLRWS